MHKSTCDVIVYSHIIRSEDINVVGHGADFEVKNVVEFVDLLGFLLKWWGSELGDFLFTNETFRKLGNDLESCGVDKILLAVDDLDGLEGPEIPNPQVEFIIEGKHIRITLKKLCRNEITRMLTILTSVSFGQGDVKRVDVDLGAKSIGKYVTAELSGVIYSQNTLLVFGIDNWVRFLWNVLECLGLSKH